MDIKFSFQELKIAQRLPSPSGTALAIMKLMRKDDVKVQEIARLAQADPALSGRLLSFANSASSGARQPIVSISSAIIRMGMSAVRNLALSLSLIHHYQKGGCKAFDYAGYWSQSLSLAVAIAAVTDRERSVSPEEAFTLGLLSDIGRLAMATAWPEAYGECLEQAQGDPLIILEQERFTIDNHALGLMLLSDWGLPGIFLDALKQSRESGSHQTSRTARFARQIAFARRIAHYCVSSQAHQAVLLPDLIEEASRHDINAGALPGFIAGITEQWHQWGRLIEIKTDVRPSPPETIADTETDIPGLSLLLVDDDPLILALLSQQLSAEGHRVQSCTSGESALKYVLEHQPQMVITDWQMSPMNGIELCNMLRASSLGNSLYLIMLTATENEDLLLEAFSAGVDDYVNKPVNLRVFLARIRAGQRIIALQNHLSRERTDIERISADLAVANRRLEFLANTDPLTNLPNRRYAQTVLEQEWIQVQRFNRPLSILNLDLDHFKSVNDTFGHDVGDQVLNHAASVMRDAVRPGDTLCRVGGEEFLIIAANTGSRAAVLLAERIRGAIEIQQFEKPVLPRPVTVSIGVASSTGAKPGWKELLKLADQAMYRVKQNGRNGVQTDAL